MFWKKRLSRKARVAINIALYAALSLGLIGFHYLSEEGFSRESNCNLHEGAVPRGYSFLNLYRAPFYIQHLAHRKEGSSSAVAELKIEENLVDIQQNVCLGREYLADLLHALNQDKRRPKVIAIDKIFSDSCTEQAEDQKSTQKLIDAIEAFKSENKEAAQIVLAQGTHRPKGAEEESEEVEKAQSCMVLTQPASFVITLAQSVQSLRLGLARLNENVLQIPKKWWVYKTEDMNQLRLREGFAQAVVDASKGVPREPIEVPEISQPKPEGNGIPGEKHVDVSLSHPYSKLYPLPEDRVGSATMLICSAWYQKHQAATAEVSSALTPAEKSIAETPWSSRIDWTKHCRGQLAGNSIETEGKIVVIGSESTLDQRLLLDQTVYGFDLQARYIASLLDGTYLEELGFWPTWLLFSFYMVMAEVVGEWYSIRKKTLMWAYSSYFAVVAVCVALPLFKKFPPIEVLVVITIALVAKIIHHYRERFLPEHEHHTEKRAH